MDLSADSASLAAKAPCKGAQGYDGQSDNDADASHIEDDFELAPSQLADDAALVLRGEFDDLRR